MKLHRIGLYLRIIALDCKVSTSSLYADMSLIICVQHEIDKSTKVPQYCG